jgi:hypothetical protein
MGSFPIRCTATCMYSLQFDSGGWADRIGTVKLYETPSVGVKGAVRILQESRKG